MLAVPKFRLLNYWTIKPFSTQIKDTSITLLEGVVVVIIDKPTNNTREVRIVVFTVGLNICNVGLLIRELLDG